MAFGHILGLLSYCLIEAKKRILSIFTEVTLLMPLILKPQQSQIAVSERRTDPYCHIWWKCYRLSAQGTETDLSTPA